MKCFKKVNIEESELLDIPKIDFEIINGRICIMHANFESQRPVLKRTWGSSIQCITNHP